MKFKVGDKVRLKPDLIAGQTYDGLTLLAPMCFSDVRTISAISTNGNYWLTEDPRGFCYAAKMLEYAPTYECGDIVKLSRPEELPGDYRYGVSSIRTDNGETLFAIKEVRKNDYASRSGEDGYEYKLCRINDSGTKLDIELRGIHWLPSGLKLFSKRSQYNFDILDLTPFPLMKTDLVADPEKIEGDLSSHGKKLELSVHKKEKKPIFNFKN